MSKFIELTNVGNEVLRGDPILINTDHITTVFENPTDGGSRVTIIFSAIQNMSWQVEESYGEVRKKIKEIKNA